MVTNLFVGETKLYLHAYEGDTLKFAGLFYKEWLHSLAVLFAVVGYLYCNYHVLLSASFVELAPGARVSGENEEIRGRGLLRFLGFCPP